MLGVLVAAAAYGGSTFVFELVGGAVVGAAMLRADGRSATVREALRLAWGRRRQLLAWALVSTVVGGVVRALERAGIGGLVAGLTLDLGWSFATVFATPVIMVEGTMPAATVRRSAGLLRQRLTVVLVSGFALEAPWVLLGFGFVVMGFAGLATALSAATVIWTTVGALLLVGGAVGFCFVLAVSSALNAYLEAFLYRHAAGLPVPGVDRHWLPPVRPA